MISSQQIKSLRKKAHPKKAIVQIGQKGLTDAVLTEIGRGLYDHELIKVRAYDPDNIAALAQAVVDATNAILVQIVGHTITLYKKRPREDKKK